MYNSMLYCEFIPHFPHVLWFYISDISCFYML